MTNSTSDSEISKFERSRSLKILRRLKLVRYFNVEINAPVEDCIERLQQLKEAKWQYHYFEPFVEANDQPHRFLVLRKYLSRDEGYIIGSFYAHPDRATTRVSYEIGPSLDILSITFVMACFSFMMICAGLTIVPFGVAPLECYVGYILFFGLPTLAYFGLSLSGRKDIAQTFSTFFFRDTFVRNIMPDEDSNL